MVGWQTNGAATGQPRQTSLPLFVHQNAGPSLTGNARLGRTQRKHEQFPQRDFSGTTWRGVLDWTPLQKTGFEFSLFREPRSIIDVAASYVLVQGGYFGPRWAPQEKLVRLPSLNHGVRSCV